MLARFANRSEPEIERPVLLPGHGKRVFWNLPAVVGSNEVIRVITAHVPSRLARLEVPRLHVAHTDGLVTVHLDVKSVRKCWVTAKRLITPVTCSVNLSALTVLSLSLSVGGPRYTWISSVKIERKSSQSRESIETG